MRVGVPLLRRKRGALSRRRSGRDDGEPELHPLPASRGGSGGDALEFSVLASAAIRRARVDGRERRTSEARVDRSAMRVSYRGRLPESRVSRRSFPNTSGGLAKSGQNPGRSASNGGHIDGKRRSGNRRRDRRGEKNQEGGAGTRRQRC